MKTSKKKILFIMHIPPPVHGAAMVGQYIKKSRTINDSYDCHYINLGTSSKIEENRKTKIIKLFRYLLILWKVFEQLISFKPHLCYLTLNAKGAAFYKDSLVVFLVKMFGVDLVYHFHNKGVSTRQNRFLDHILYRLVFKNTQVILLSKYLYPDIQKYVQVSRIHYCPNGIPEEANNDHSQYPSKKRDTIIILYLSNLFESKGVIVLLEACKILKNKNLNFQCIIAGGEGDITEKQFKIIIQQSNLSDCLIYAGKKYGQDKKDIYASADIFAFPTYYSNECFPLVLIEAMQHRLPMVTTFEGGIPDIVEDNVTGYLVAQRDVDLLAAKLEILILNSKLRLQMGESGRKKYEQEFTIGIFETRFVEILQLIISKQKRIV